MTINEHSYSNNKLAARRKQWRKHILIGNQMETVLRSNSGREFRKHFVKKWRFGIQREHKIVLRLFDRMRISEYILYILIP